MFMRYALITLPQGSVFHAMDLCHRVYSSVICETHSYILSCIHALSQSFAECSAVEISYHIFCISVQRGKLIYLWRAILLTQTGLRSHCSFLKGHFHHNPSLKRDISYISFRIMTLWRARKAAVVPLCFCSGSALWLQRQFLRWKPAATCLMGYVRDF